MLFGFVKGKELYSCAKRPQPRPKANKGSKRNAVARLASQGLLDMGWATGRQGPLLPRFCGLA